MGVAREYMKRRGKGGVPLKKGEENDICLFSPVFLCKTGITCVFFFQIMIVPVRLLITVKTLRIFDTLSYTIGFQV